MPIDLERRGAIAIVTMNRPEALNAFDHEQLRMISESFEEIDRRRFDPLCHPDGRR